MKYLIYSFPYVRHHVLITSLYLIYESFDSCKQLVSLNYICVLHLRPRLN